MHGPYSARAPVAGHIFDRAQRTQPQQEPAVNPLIYRQETISQGELQTAAEKVPPRVPFFRLCTEICEEPFFSFM
jgi:hypothetical protein